MEGGGVDWLGFTFFSFPWACLPACFFIAGWMNQEGAKEGGVKEDGHPVKSSREICTEWIE